MTVTILILALCASVAFEFNFLWEDTEILWLGLLLGACVAPAVFVFLSRRFDPFEPVYPIIISTFIYYGLMVIILLIQGDSFRMLSIDYRSEVPKVVFLALLALIGFYMGYYGWGSLASQPPKKQKMTEAEMGYTRRCAFRMLMFFGALFALWILIARVPLWSLWIFGGARYGAWNIEAEGAKLGHLYSAIEALPACALLLIASRKTRAWSLGSIILLVVIAVIYSGLGIRARLVLLFGSAFVFYHLESGKRPSTWHVAVLGFIVFYFIVGAIGYYRGLGDSGSGAAGYGLSTAWENFLEGSNIATTTAVYVRWIPEFGNDWGEKFLAILLVPIPSAVWPDKYLAFESPVQSFLSTGAAAAFFTEFYESFGPAGVVCGMALGGWMCRQVYNKYQASRDDPFVQISLALLWGFLFHAYGRNSITLIVIGVLYTFGPVWIARLMLGYRHRVDRRALTKFDFSNG